MTEPPPIIPGHPVPPSMAAAPAPLPQATTNLRPLYWLAGGMALFIAICATGLFGLSTLNDDTPRAPVAPQEAPAERDVVVSCRNSSTGFATVNVYVNNTTSRVRTYFVSVSLRSGSTRVGTTTVTVRDVGSHETASEDWTVSVSSAVSICETTNVSRV